ncbi:hypothetical protein FOA52_001136 [Chlamydomonas sp. UWO 241]|nr:hypothetical protein FOA52_001136 [Chlamydomonas sp. UWO 241]
MRARWSVKDYRLLRQVHRGYASDVYKAQCTATQRLVALKVYAVEQLDDIPRVQLSREVRLHSMCAHPNIVQFFAAFVEDLPETPGAQAAAAAGAAAGGDGAAAAAPAASPPSLRKLCRAVVIVVDWAGGGNLLHFMQRQGGRLSEARAVNLVVLPLLKSLRYLHSTEIVHRDIKPENMIFDEEMTLKMADFGLAIDVKVERANTRAGTLDYMAPEVLLCPTKVSPADFKFQNDARCYTTGVDSWATGAIFYELLTGYPPFRSSSMRSTAQKIIAGTLTFPEGMSPAARDFITACLQVNPADRPTVLELLDHPVLLKMRRHASYQVAARRSSTFVDFISQQIKEEKRLQRKTALAAEPDLWMQAALLSSKSRSHDGRLPHGNGQEDGLNGDEDDDEDGDEDDDAVLMQSLNRMYTNEG